MHFLRFMLFSLLIMSCSKGDSVITFLNINEDHTIGLTQVLSNQGGNLAISIQTKQELKCDNLNLNHVINQNDNSVSLWLNGYDDAIKCSNIPGIVKTNIGLKTFNQTLDLKIILNYETIIEKLGKLSYNNGTYAMDLDNDFGISSLNNNLRLVEQNTYWGQIWYDDTKTPYSTTEWENIQKKYNTEKLIQGNYTFFTVNKDFYSLGDQTVKPNGVLLAAKLTKSNFNQFVSELSATPNLRYAFRAFDDKRYEK